MVMNCWSCACAPPAAPTAAVSASAKSLFLMPKPPSRFELSAPPEETRRSRRLQNNCHSYVNIEYICFHNAPDNPAACRPETARISNRLSTDVCRNREGPTAPVTDQKHARKSTRLNSSH